MGTALALTFLGLLLYNLKKQGRAAYRKAVRMVAALAASGALFTTLLIAVAKLVA